MKILDIQRNRIYCLVVVSLFVSSCASNKDIYRNPYQPTSKGTPITNTEYETNVPPSQQPDWIYAVSKDFFVGYGSGKDIMEAKNAALNDIKAFIIKSLGETGNVVEVNFIQNSVTGRNAADSQEAYLMKHQFENKYKPVINISVDRFDDYYYEKTVGSAKYYIKYNINADELNRIKNEFQISLQKGLTLAAKTHQLVDSLVKFPANPNLELVTDRYNTISNYLFSANLESKDSLRLINGLQNIRIFLNTLEIRILEHEPGKFVRFGLFNGQIPVSSKTKPGVNATGIQIDTLIQNNESWELRYKSVENSNSTGSLEVYYDLAVSRLAVRIPIPRPVIKPIFEIIDKIQMSDFEKNAWNGVLTGLTVRMNINYNDKTDCTLTSMEILLHSGNGDYPSISVNNLSFILTTGVNGFAKTIKSDLPVRFFLMREMECDLILYYKSDNNLDKFQIKNIPVTINK